MSIYLALVVGTITGAIIGVACALAREWRQDELQLLNGGR